MNSLLTDASWALRLFRRNRWFALAAVSTAALGIGANTAIFSVVNSVLLQPLPYPDPDRLVVINEGMRGRTGRMTVSYPSLLDWQQQARSFEAMAGYRGTMHSLSGVDVPDRPLGRMVSAEFFDLLGAKPFLGRLLTRDDDRPGAAPVVVLSHNAWKTRFGGDPRVLGRKIVLDDTPAEIIGVLPSGFQLGARQDEVFLTLAQMPTRMGTQRSALDRGNHQGIFALARLKSGVTLQQGAEEMKAIAARIEQQYPNTNSGVTAMVTSLYELSVGNVRTTLLVLLAAVALVLLIACANIANLLLARATGRTREIAVRTTLGAGRWRLVRQLLTESVLLSLFGGAAGIALAYWSIRGLLKIVPGDIPRLAGTSIDPWVLAFTLAASILTGVLFGLVPALYASRLDVNDCLKSEGRGLTGGRGGNRLRRLLLVSEVALALVLSIGAGLMIRSLGRLRNVDPGFEPEKLLTLRLSLNSAYDKPDRRVAYVDQMLDRLRSVPGVKAASTVLCLPISGTCWGSVFIIEGRPVPRRAELLSSQFNVVGTDYFEAMGIRLLRGRTFNRFDTLTSNTVAVINESAARRFFPGQDPIGKRVKQGWPESKTPWREIAGVVADVKQNGLDAEQLPEIFLPYAQDHPGSPAIVVRTASTPGALISPVRDAIREVDKSIPLYSIRPMDELLSNSLSRRNFSMVLLAIFAASALLLAAVGIYGVIAYSVAQRRQEIGVRIALGARQAQVVRMVVGEAMAVAGAGIALGLAAAFGLARFMKTMLFGVESTDPASYAAVATLLALVALAASYVPARRASRTDPSLALRWQ